MDCPTSLKSVKPYLDRASEVQAKDPIVAYHCRLFALQEAMKLRASVPKADMGFVLSLMDQCEKEKGALGEMDEPAITVENFAQDLFQRADDADRAGRSDLRTGKAFLAASHIFDVCKQFEELPADISEKAKYAKWRFVEIAKATKEGRPPAPPRGDPPAEAEPPPPAEGAPPPPMPADAVPPAAPAYAAPPPAAAAGAPPAYMGLPAAPPPVGHQASPGMSALPQAPQAMPAVPAMPAAPAPAAAFAPMPGFKPTRAAIQEAQRVVQQASSALAFQDSDTATQKLLLALNLLTQPPPPPPPE